MASFLTASSGVGAFAQQTLPALEKAPATLSAKEAAVRGQISISREVNIAPETQKVSLNMRNASIRDVLNMLAKQGNFNLILDSAIEGELTVDLTNISINKALEYIFTVSNFTFAKDGNTLIVAPTDTAQERNLAAQTFKAIPVQYKSAADMAFQLNNTLFSMNRPNGNRNAVVAFDGDSNSILIMGTETDIRMVGDFLREMDVPRNRKVYHIRHNMPIYVANVIAANFFTPTISGAVAGGGGGAAGVGGAGGVGGGGGAAGAGGAGGAAGAAGGGGAAGAGGVGGAAGAAGGGGAATGGGIVSPAPTVINTGGVTLIAEAVSSTLTVMGTEEQIALVDAIIDQVDVKRPQVAIELALVEMGALDSKALLPNMSPLQFGEFNLNLVDSGTASSILGWSNTGSRAAGTTRNRIFPLTSLTLQHQFTTSRVKVLANPTIVALDGMASTLDITDQIETINETVVTSGGASTTTTTITTNPVGISMSVTPTIFNDGSVVLNLTPNITTPGREVSAGGGSTTRTTLISGRSLNLSGVRIMDGQTLVIGGLLSNRETNDMRKVPVLGDLPVVGGLFRTQGSTTGPNTKNKTELVMLVTPHILKDDGITYFQDQTKGNPHFNNPNSGNVKPVNLPKFITGQDEDRNVRNGIFPWDRNSKAVEKQQARIESVSDSTTNQPPSLQADNPTSAVSLQSRESSRKQTSDKQVKIGQTPTSIDQPIEMPMIEEINHPASKFFNQSSLTPSTPIKAPRPSELEDLDTLESLIKRNTSP